MGQTNNQVIELLGQYNDSIAPRRLILFKEAQENPALNAKCQANWNLIRSWIVARFANEETPATFERVGRAVSALHKGSAGLFWVDGCTPGMVRETEKPKDNVINSQGDIRERQEADRKAKVDATTLANAQSRCSNYDCRPHSVRFDRRNRLLAEFKRLSETPGITAEQVAKGVDQAIVAMEKSAPVPQPIRGV
jgi:hypothetical protein